MAGVLRAIGSKPIREINKASMIASRDKRRATPAQARNFLDTMRGLFRWALDANHVQIDPTAGVKNPERKAGAGFPIWTEADITAFESRWPLGTKERVWLDVLCYTGLRRGDAVRLGPAHVAAGFLDPEKTDLAIPIIILPILQATLDAGPIGTRTFIVGKNGKALTKESFGNFFKAACLAAGVNKSAHGLRKIAATRAANAGATVAELEALFGWSGGGMASLYTRAADRARLAKGAAGKLERSRT
jgi:integrase